MVRGPGKTLRQATTAACAAKRPAGTCPIQLAPGSLCTGRHWRCIRHAQSLRRWAKRRRRQAQRCRRPPAAAAARRQGRALQTAAATRTPPARLPAPEPPGDPGRPGAPATPTDACLLRAGACQALRQGAAPPLRQQAPSRCRRGRQLPPRPPQCRCCWGRAQQACTEFGCAPRVARCLVRLQEGCGKRSVQCPS